MKDTLVEAGFTSLINAKFNQRVLAMFFCDTRLVLTILYVAKMNY